MKTIFHGAVIMLIATIHGISEAPIAIGGPIVLQTVTGFGSTSESSVLFPLDSGDILPGPVMGLYSDGNGAYAEGKVMATVLTTPGGLSVATWTIADARTGSQFESVSVTSAIDVYVEFSVDPDCLLYELSWLVDQQDYVDGVVATVNLVSIDGDDPPVVVWASTHTTDSFSVNGSQLVLFDPNLLYAFQIEGTVTAEALLGGEDLAYLDVPYLTLECVPEPSALVLAALGALGLVGLGVRRRIRG